MHECENMAAYIYCNEYNIQCGSHIAQRTQHDLKHIRCYVWKNMLHASFVAHNSHFIVRAWHSIYACIFLACVITHIQTIKLTIIDNTSSHCVETTIMHYYSAGR